MSGRNKCSFSIEHILNVAGASASKTPLPSLHFDWLSCTRYRPPRIQRPKKKEGVQRRNPGRNPRIPFSSAQVALLESTYQQTPYLSSHEVHQLAATLQLSEIRVKIWFQNRRARERREQEVAKTKENGPDEKTQFSPESKEASAEYLDTNKTRPQTRLPSAVPGLYRELREPNVFSHSINSEEPHNIDNALHLRGLGWLFKK